MELIRGVCVLCTNNTNVIVPPQGKDLTLVIKDVLVDQCDDKKFDAINPSLKVCPVCVHDVLTTASLRKNIKDFNEDVGGCVLCYRKKTHLVSVSDWVHFDKSLLNVTLAERQSDCLACLDCIKCLGMLERMKTNLFKKYPNLRLTDFIEKRKNENAEYKKAKIEPAKKTKKYIESEKKDKSGLSSFQHNKKNVNDVKAALKHLNPVKNTKFNVDGLKDKKLLKQIPYVKLNLSTNMSLTKSRKSVGSSESESSADSPSPKQSFFKIRLKISSNKPKLAKVLSSKVSKPRISHSKLNSKKQLIVKLLKMDLDEIRLFDVENGLHNRTPTKASRKMLPDEPLSSSKKRKSVTFAEELDTEIIESLNRKNHLDVTPLKSSLKKKNVHFVDSTSKIGNDESNHETDDDDDNVNLQKRSDSVNDDSEEEIITNSKGYVEEIQKNNDDIFNSLKKSENLEVTSKELKSQISELCDTNICNSKNDNVVDKSAKGNTDDDVSECIPSSEIKNNGEKDSSENGDEGKKVVDKATSVNKINMTEENEVISEEENDSDKSRDRNAISDETNTKDNEKSVVKTNGEVVLDNKHASVENESSQLDDPDDELDNLEKSPESESYDGVSSLSKNTIETSDNENEISSTVNIDSVQCSETLVEDNIESFNNDKIGAIDDINKSNEDLEAQTGQKSVSKKRRRSTLEREEEDKDLIDDNGFGEPETKKEKVSETDDVNNAVSEKEIEREEDDNSSKQTVAAVDNKIDELITKYANPGVQNLNVDNNVSDRRNAGANGKDQGSRSEDSPRGSEEAVEAEAAEQSDNFKNNSEEEKSDEVTSKNIDSALIDLNPDYDIIDDIVDDSFIAGAEQ